MISMGVLPAAGAAVGAGSGVSWVCGVGAGGVWQSATVEQVEAALAGEHVDVVSDESDPPSNLSAAGQEELWCG